MSFVVTLAWGCLLVDPSLLPAESTITTGLQTIRASASAPDQESRVRLLRPLTQHTAQSDLAHWHLGQLRSGETWISIADYVEQRSQDPLLQEYVTRRAEVQQGRGSEFALAGWCRKNGMRDAENVHLHHVVRSSQASAADRIEAMQRLGLKVYQGRLRTGRQVDQIERRLERERRQDAKWRPIIGQWISAIDSAQGRKKRYAVEKLRSLKDPEAILTLESLLARRSEPYAKQFVAILEAIADDRSTASLVRQSVDAPWKTVRTAAIRSLKGRPLHDHTPRLLDELNSPIESRFRVGIDADGMVRRSHQIYQEGQNEKHLATIINARGPERINRAVARELPGGRVALSPVRSTVGSRPRLRRNASEYTAQELAQWKANVERQQRVAFARQVIARQEAVRALQVQAELSQMNERFKQRNQAVFVALRETTGKTEMPSATVSWWDWWDEYNDLYREEKPVRTYVAGRSDPLQVSFVPVDCFPAGTLVHTEVGPRPIETIHAGDRVLSQNVDTGELVYKVVVRRTTRPAGEILNVSLANGEMVQTTKGHAFWVNNVGWRMAKRLSSQHHVHAVLGNGRVAKVESHAEQLPAINLVVADFGTFFVGKTGMLVHGTPRRQATTALVPGVRAEQLEWER